MEHRSVANEWKEDAGSGGKEKTVDGYMRLTGFREKGDSYERNLEKVPSENGGGVGSIYIGHQCGAGYGTGRSL